MSRRRARRRRRDDAGDPARRPRGRPLDRRRHRSARRARGARLCPRGRGPCGVSTWNDIVESWLANELDRFDEDGWYVGRPLLVTRNDYGPRLYNGDTGVIVARDGGRRTAVFERQGGPVEISPTRLCGTEAAVSAALDRPVAHASGFARRLWS